MNKEDITARRRELIAEISAKMLECGLSQKEMADKLGVNPSQISIWMSSDRNFSLDTYIKLHLACSEKIAAAQCSAGAKVEDASALGDPEIPYGDIGLGTIIRRELRRKKMSQKELADLVGTSQSRISEYIRGTVVPNLGVSARICLALDIDKEEFIRACSRL